MVSRAKRKKIYFSVFDVFNCPTIYQLASVVMSEAQELMSDVQHSILEDVPLTPIQTMFLHEYAGDKNEYFQTIFLQLTKKLNITHLSRIFDVILLHHDSLRMRFIDGDEWIQCCISQEVHKICEVFELSDSTTETLSLEIERHIADIKKKIDIANGPLIQVALFNCPDTQYIFLIAHHLVTDGVSWKIILEDVENLYWKLMSGEDLKLPPKTHSYLQWSKALYEFTALTLLKELRLWQDIIAVNQAKNLLYDTTQSITVSITLDKESTSKLISGVHQKYDVEVIDVLLCTLVMSLANTADSEIIIGLEHHGRDVIKHLDLSRTVGWFTSIFPIRLPANSSKNFIKTIQDIKHTRQNIPNKGMGFGALKYIAQSELDYSCIDMLFNYLGQWDNVVSSGGLFTYPQQDREYKLSGSLKFSHQIDVIIRNQKLQLFWSSHAEESKIRVLAQFFMNSLIEIISFLERQGPSMSNQDQLENVINEIVGG
jgi:non-ribosomal peptide synthase protein (TIGR01720 family)